MVQQNVKAEDLEAGGAAVVGGEAGAVVVPEDCMGRHQCLDDYILHKMTGEKGSGAQWLQFFSVFFFFEGKTFFLTSKELWIQATDSPWFCSAEL